VVTGDEFDVSPHALADHYGRLAQRVHDGTDVCGEAIVRKGPFRLGAVTAPGEIELRASKSRAWSAQASRIPDVLVVQESVDPHQCPVTAALAAEPDTGAVRSVQSVS
jgi:hypothetical protein